MYKCVNCGNEDKFYGIAKEQGNALIFQNPQRSNGGNCSAVKELVHAVNKGGAFSPGPAENKPAGNTVKNNLWAIQNSIIDFLKTPDGINLIKTFDFDKQFYLGRLFIASAKKNHWKSIHFINDIFLNEEKIFEYLKAGIAFGYIFDLNDFFNFELQFLESIKIINLLNIKIQNKVYTLFLKLLKKKKNIERINDFFNFGKIQEEENRTLQDMADWNSNNKEKFEILISEIKQIIHQN